MVTMIQVNKESNKPHGNLLRSSETLHGYPENFHGPQITADLSLGTTDLYDGTI